MSKELWSNEYLRQGIPSSYRKEATKIVLDFLTFLKRRGCDSGKALDLGCGKGRNAFFLADNGFEVTALDWVEENICTINAQAQQNDLKLEAICQSVVLPWPVADASIDIAIDIFCYKHIVDKLLQAQYRAQLFSALKPGGYYLISLAADDDGFYGPLLKNSPAPDQKLILDPHSKIGSFLYTFDELNAEFSEDFKVVFSENYQNVSPMYGTQYPRSVLNVIFQRAH